VGLDLVVEGCAKPGHDREWRRLLERSFSDEQLSEAEIARFQEICVPGYERIGAPRVGFDAAADAWIIEAQNARTPEDVATTLEKFHGYHVLQILKSDGVPTYSNGGSYDGVDETSFRGAFLSSCKAIISHDLLEQAWAHKLPEEAVAYGRALLAAADAAETLPRDPSRGFLARIGLTRSAEPLPLSEQLDIVRVAGRWFTFWGERGHPIRAWF
jgi:hypothetical protein